MVCKMAAHNKNNILYYFVVFMLFLQSFYINIYLIECGLIEWVDDCMKGDAEENIFT